MQETRVQSLIQEDPHTPQSNEVHTKKGTFMAQSEWKLVGRKEAKCQIILTYGESPRQFSSGFMSLGANQGDQAQIKVIYDWSDLAHMQSIVIYWIRN